MDVTELLEALRALPSLGWVTGPSPVSRLAAEPWGLPWLGVKRDDLGLGLIGGTKIRKLDLILAAEPWSSAPAWASVGAIGSGHLAALSAAARSLDRRLVATTFWEPPSAAVLRTLAYTASGPGTVDYVGGRIELALRRPSLLLAQQSRGQVVIPPGATTPQGIVGAVIGGLELAAQVAAGTLPEPEVIVLPLGTGGTAVGLALGVGLAGLSTEVLAVAAVERVLSPLRRVHGLAAATRRRLGELGLDPGVGPLRLRVERGFVGPGYGIPSDASLRACDWLADQGVLIEPIYGGKALAAVLARVDGLRGRRVLFWQTACSKELDAAPGWRQRLPDRLQRRLAAERPGGPARGPTRRRVLVAAAVVAAVGLPLRLGLHEQPPQPGRVLSDAELHILAAVAEAVLDESGGDTAPGTATAAPPPDGWTVAARVDRYLVSMPAPALLEIHGMFALLEQGTMLDGSLLRLTRLPIADRLSFLARLSALGSLPAQAARGVRDLVYLGTWQDPVMWTDIGYGGPLVDRPAPKSLSTAELRASGQTAAALLAPPGARPRSLVS